MKAPKVPKASRSDCPLKIFSFSDALCVAVASFISACMATTVVLIATVSQGIDVQSLYRMFICAFAVFIVVLTIVVMIERRNDIKAWHIANDKESNETNII